MTGITFIWNREVSRLSVLKKWNMPITWAQYTERTECNIFALSKEVFLSLCRVYGKGVWYVR